jgi:hypothetical protein
MIEHKTFRDTLEISLILLTPMAVFCLMLPHNIIRLVFQRGQFTPGATALMTTIFFYYSLSLLPFAFVRLLNFASLPAASPTFIFASPFFITAWFWYSTFSMSACCDSGRKEFPSVSLPALCWRAGLAIRRNLGDLHVTLNGVLGRVCRQEPPRRVFCHSHSGSAAIWVATTGHGGQDFTFLCITCGLGSVAYLATLAALQALPMAQLALLWSRESAS